MYLLLLATGAMFGFAAGLYLGLPAFALGVILTLAAQVIADAKVDLESAALIWRAFGLAAALHASYGLGLLVRRIRTPARAPSE